MKNNKVTFLDLIDAGLTSTAKRSHDEEKWGPKAKFINLPKHGEYKYQILLDGTVAPFRSPALFMHNSLIFKQDSGKKIRNFESCYFYNLGKN